MTKAAVRFRHNTALTVAAVVVMITLISVLTWAPYLLVLEVVPLAVAIWSWRAGTDVSPGGLTVRALLGRRSIPWRGGNPPLTPDPGRGSAPLHTGRAAPPPAG